MKKSLDFKWAAHNIYSWATHIGSMRVSTGQHMYGIYMGSPFQNITKILKILVKPMFLK